MKALTAERLLQIESAGGSAVLWSLSDYTDELANPESRLLTWPLGVMDAKGFVLYRVLDDEAWIMQLAVETKGRGQGTGLLRTCLDFWRKSGLQTVGLEVSEKNLAACKLYDKFGFVKIGERKAYYRNGDNAWVLKCRL